MKHRVVFPIILVILLSLACQPSGQTPAEENLVPTQTQETTVEPTVTLIPTETPKPQETFSTGSEIESEKDGMTLVFVPAGEFIMGVNAADAFAECENVIEPSAQLSDLSAHCNESLYWDEEPPHSVTLDAFWIDKTEITNKMYSLCVSAGVCSQPEKTNSSTYPSYYGNPEFDNYPVINVTWDMAKAYCDWAGRYLPTEAQWEKAARGDSSNIYPWGDTFEGTEANFCDQNCPHPWAYGSFDDGYEDVAPVGSYPAGQSIYGALDMSGNVTEWVDDWYEAYPGGNRQGSSDFGQQFRVLRGGSYSDGGDEIRSFNRRAYFANFSFGYVGFRCALSP